MILSCGSCTVAQELCRGAISADSHTHKHRHTRTHTHTHTHKHTHKHTSIDERPWMTLSLPLQASAQVRLAAGHGEGHKRFSGANNGRDGLLATTATAPLQHQAACSTSMKKRMCVHVFWLACTDTPTHACAVTVADYSPRRSLSLALFLSLSLSHTHTHTYTHTHTHINSPRRQDAS